MKPLNFKGFTLIELLAVIVILAVIALIATPLILNVISNVRRGAFEATVLGIKDAAEKEYILNTLNGTKVETTYTFSQGNQIVSPDTQKPLEFSGSAPSEGYIKLYEDGSIELGLTDGSYYVKKDKEGQVADAVDYVADSPEQPVKSGYLVSYTASTGGSISPTHIVVESGSSVLAPTLTANIGYGFSDFEITSGNGNAVLDTQTGALTNVTGDITIRANFILDGYVVTYNGNGGTCTPANRVVDSGGSADAPSCTREGYAINNFSITSGSCAGTFDSSTGACSDVQANLTITANWTMVCNTTTCEGCSVGESCGGGQYYFYNAADSSRYIVAPNDEASTYSWTGAQTRCDSVTYGGYTDWFFADSIFYEKALDVKDTLGGFASDYYWTNTETHVDGPNAWARHFGTGDFLAEVKTALHRVRCVRKTQ